MEPFLKMGFAFEEHNQFVRVVKWESVKQHAIHDRENCGVCADAKSERQQSYRGEAGILPQVAESVANVFHQRVH